MIPVLSHLPGGFVVTQIDVNAKMFLTEVAIEHILSISPSSFVYPQTEITQHGCLNKHIFVPVVGPG